jgi:hypothetical protein
LLIEEGRTNLATYSGALVINTGWASSETTSTTSGTGPDGNTSYQVSETSATSIHTIANSGGITTSPTTLVTSGTVYTGSIFFKKVTGSIDWVQLTFGSAGFGGAQYANFNIGNGTVGNSAGLASGTSPRIEDYGNGWYRCSISVASTSTATTLNLITAFVNNTNGTTRVPSYAGSTSNQVLASLCQFEAGSFATSYIPTTTGSAARSADVCSITGGDFSGIYNTPEGTLFAGVTPQSVAQAAVVVGVNTANYINSHFILKADSLTTSAGLRWVGVSFPPVNIIPSTLNAANAFAKIAYAYKSGSFAVAYNNILAGTSSTTFTSINPTVMRIGGRDDGLSINGHISEVKYFKKRLPNAKLQALTV